MHYHVLHFEANHSREPRAVCVGSTVREQRRGDVMWCDDSSDPDGSERVGQDLATEDAEWLSSLKSSVVLSCDPDCDDR